MASEKRSGPDQERLKTDEGPERALKKLITTDRHKLFDVTYLHPDRDPEIVSTSHDSVEQARAAGERWWREQGCGDRVEDGEVLLVVERPGVQSAKAVYSGYWE